MEQLAHGGERVELRDRPVAVHGLIAEPRDDHGLVEHRRAGGRLERGLVDECAEIVLIRELEGGVVLVEPAHRELQRPPRVEARGARIHQRVGLGLGRGRV